jgi:hypothetical protein
MLVTVARMYITERNAMKNTRALPHSHQMFPSLLELVVCRLLSYFRQTVNTLISVPAKYIYRGADKSLARPTSRCILFDGENISFDVSFVIYINSTNIPWAR